jgi:hypothetical protein
MECVQWLFDYSQKAKTSKGKEGGGQYLASTYNGYLRRQEALRKQLESKGMYIEPIDQNEGQAPLPNDITQAYMSPHLIPTRVSWHGL